MNSSKFYSSLFLLIVLNAIVKPVWIFGIDRQVQNITGVAEYGTYFSLLNLSIVFGFLLDWGVNNFVNRELAARKMELQQRLGSLLLLKLIFFVAYALVVVAVGWLSSIKRWDILTGVVVIQFLTFLFLFLRSVVTANQWFSTDAWLSVLDKALMILVCGSIIVSPFVFGPMSIDKFVVAQIVCTSSAIVVALVILLARHVNFERPSFRFFNKTVIVSVLPFALTLFLMSVHIRLDGFLLERLRPDGAREAGIYAAAFRLLDASNMVGYLIASFLMPFVARQWADGKPVKAIVLQARHLQLMFAITVSSITIVLATGIQQLLYHRTDLYGVQILRWCLPSLIGYGLTQVYGTVMTATGRIRAFAYFNLAAVVINVTLNVLLIPKWGAFGCCISALCSQLFLGLSTMTFVHKDLRMAADVRSLVFYPITGLLICVLLYGLLKATLNLSLLILVAGLTAFLVMSLTRMISLSGLLGFLKKQ